MSFEGGRSREDPSPCKPIGCERAHMKADT